MSQRVFPVLRILDEAKAKDFYVDQLGFTVDWEWRHEPHYPIFMAVSKEGLAFFLSEHSGDAEVGGRAYLAVEDVDAWYAEASERGAKADSPPQDQPWGQREVTFCDPFGNRITMGTRLPDTKA